MEKQDIKSLTREKLTAAITGMGLPKFRAEQIFSWLHQKNVKSFDEMTNLSAALREQLSEQFYIPQLKIVRKLVSQIDGTVKYLFERQQPVYFLPGWMPDGLPVLRIHDCGLYQKSRTERAAGADYHRL